MDKCVWLTCKIPSDSSGEVANDHFMNMCKAMNINFKLTSTESPKTQFYLRRYSG